MKMPAISVLMSCYNAERWLKDAIESVLSQSFRDFEFIIVNDGSCDRTSAILHTYVSQDSRIVIIDKVNTGLADSLNHGINSARGRWIARVDADDLCMPERLIKQFNYASCNPNVVLLGSGFVEINESGSTIKTHNYPADHKQLVCRLEQNRAFFPHSSAFYRRDVVSLLGGYRSHIRRAQDWDLWLRLSERGQLRCLPDYLVKIRKHGEQVSRDDKGRRQLIDCHAGIISYFVRRKGGYDPVSVADEDTTRQFCTWVEMRLEEDRLFECSSIWLRARAELFEAPSQMVGIMKFLSIILRSGCAFRLLKGKLAGSVLPEHLATEWMRQSSAAL